MLLSLSHLTSAVCQIREAFKELLVCAAQHEAVHTLYLSAKVIDTHMKDFFKGFNILLCKGVVFHC